MAGVKLNHVPYRGSGQATTDLIGGVVKVSVPGLAGMLPHIRSGKLRALAITGSHRSPQLPDVPTLAESGVPRLFEPTCGSGCSRRRARRRRSSTC